MAFEPAERARFPYLRTFLHVALALTAVACAGDKPDTADTALVCPYDVETFCLFEFGGACPTYEQAAAMTCDGYHFDPTGSTGEAPITTDGHEECPYPIVACHVDYDVNIRTSMFFNGVGDGTIEMIDLIWTDEPVCNFNGVVGNIVC